MGPGLILFTFLLILSWGTHGAIVEDVIDPRPNLDSSEAESDFHPSPRPSIRKCCPMGQWILKSLDPGAKEPTYSCTSSPGTNNYSWDPQIWQTPAILSNRTSFDYQFLSGFPQCSNTSRYFTNSLFSFKILEDGRAIISCEHPDGNKASMMAEIWLGVDELSYCVDTTGEEGKGTEIILICEDILREELQKVWQLLSSSLHSTFTSAAKTTGIVSIVSALILGFALVIYIILRKSHKVHQWTQFSFLLALFTLYLIAGLRRLVGFEYQILRTSHSASVFGLLQNNEALEDFGAVATSANLVALSFDLFFTLIRLRSTSSKRDGMTRFCITTTLAWLIGLIVMFTGLVLKEHRKGTPDLEYSEVTRLEKYLPKLLEFFLCIQNDMVFAICIPVAQIFLCFLNLIIFFSSVYVLWKGRRESAILRENQVNKWEDRKIWIRRFLILFILMGLWWPLIIICVFECVVVFKFAVRDWKAVLNRFYTHPDHVDVFNIPWHMYFIPHTLAVQAIIVCLLFICNQKTWSALAKEFPTISNYIKLNLRAPHHGVTSSSGDPTEDTTQMTAQGSKFYVGVESGIGIEGSSLMKECET